MVRNRRWSHVCNDAVGISVDERDILRERVRTHPADLEARVRLIGAYWLNPTNQTQLERAHQLAWLFAEHPDVDLLGFSFTDSRTFPDAYAVGKEGWLKALANYGDQPGVLRGAGEYMYRSEPEEAATLYHRGAALEPANSSWREALGHLWTSAAQSAATEEDALALALRALDEFELALALEADCFSRFGLLIDLAKAAVEAERYDRAIEVASQIMALAPEYADTFQYGNAVHVANIALGRVALAQGEYSTAIERLLLAGATRGSPQLDSFGPDFELASALLESGERDAVLSYFRACLRFWKLGEDDLRDWIAALERGEEPWPDDD